MDCGTSSTFFSELSSQLIAKNREKNKIIIISAIDNLIKGASGQAVQNMNVAYDLKETMGLL